MEHLAQELHLPQGCHPFGNLDLYAAPLIDFSVETFPPCQVNLRHRLAAVGLALLAAEQGGPPLDIFYFLLMVSIYMDRQPVPPCCRF